LVRGEPTQLGFHIESIGSKKFRFPNWKSRSALKYMQGQDTVLLLKLAMQNDPRIQSKNLAEELFISPSKVSKALKRCVLAGLLYISGAETALMEFLVHGLKYVFPPARGSMAQGLPTAVAAEPLKSRFLEDKESPPV